MIEYFLKQFFLIIFACKVFNNNVVSRYFSKMFVMENPVKFSAFAVKFSASSNIFRIESVIIIRHLSARSENILPSHDA